MNFIGLNKYDTANGPGIRVSLFVSGCTLHCRGCFNKESWRFDAGKPFTSQKLDEIIKELQEPWVEGFSLLGGDPFEPCLHDDILNIVKTLKPLKKSIWVWTGRVLEDLKGNEILNYIDVLVDGPFIQDLKGDYEYRGSSNQRILIKGVDF